MCVSTLLIDAYKDQTGEKIAGTRNQCAAYMQTVDGVHYDANTQKYTSRSLLSRHIVKMVKEQKDTNSNPRRNNNFSTNFNRSFPTVIRPTVNRPTVSYVLANNLIIKNQTISLKPIWFSFHFRYKHDYIDIAKTPITASKIQRRRMTCGAPPLAKYVY